METIHVYASTTIHLIFVLLLWRKVYPKLKQKKAGINLSIWIVGILTMLYCILMINVIRTAFSNDIVDTILFIPCYMIAFPLLWLLMFNLIYSIILLIQKWISTPLGKN